MIREKIKLVTWKCKSKGKRPVLRENVIMWKTWTEGGKYQICGEQREGIRKKMSADEEL